MTMPVIRALTSSVPKGWPVPVLRVLVVWVTVALTCFATQAQGGGSNFAGTWEWSVPLKGKFTLAVNGNSISGDWDDPTNEYWPVHKQLRAELTGSGDTAKGTFTIVILSDKSLYQDYNVELSFDPHTRDLVMRGHKITRGVDDLEITAHRPVDWDVPPGMAVLTYSCTLGYDMPTSLDRAMALRIFVSLTPEYRNEYSISDLAAVNRNPDIRDIGRQAITSSEPDGFFFYTDDEHLIVNPPAGAKEASYEVVGVDFGQSKELNLPRTVKATLRVTLKDTQGRTRKEVLDMPIRVEHLYTVVSHRCLPPAYPTFKAEKLKPGEARKGLRGDPLALPGEASAYVKFLDGSLGYFVNNSPVTWNLTMACGHWGSFQGEGYAENRATIRAVVEKVAKDKIRGEPLEILLARTAGKFVGKWLGAIVEFLESEPAAGSVVAIRLRSKVGVTLYADGRAVVRNFEGAPEVLQEGRSPLPIPVGYQVSKGRAQEFQSPVRISPQDPSVTMWSDLLGKPSPSAQAQPGSGGVPVLAPDLGRVWSVVEVGEWIGMWTRRPGSNTFDAVWHNTKQPGEVRDEITLESVEGNKVVLYRKGNNGRYKGTLSPDRRSILSGTASWYQPDWIWTAQIR